MENNLNMENFKHTSRHDLLKPTLTINYVQIFQIGTKEREETKSTHKTCHNVDIYKSRHILS